MYEVMFDGFFRPVGFVFFVARELRCVIIGVEFFLSFLGDFVIWLAIMRFFGGVSGWMC